ADDPGLVVTSIESDWKVLRAVKHATAARNADDRISLLFADIGPTGDNSFPVDDENFRHWHRYPVEPWHHCASRGQRPDLVLIDGRFRRACFLSSRIFAAPGTQILFDDFADRAHYHGVERFL